MNAATVPEIIEKYEVPQEYHAALWEAYEEGSKRGFISGALSVTEVANENS